MGWQGEGEDGTNWQSRTDICTLHVSSVAKSCLILKPHERYPARRLCPWDFPGSILEWVAMPSSSGSSQPGDQTHLSYIGRQALYHWATRETQHIYPAAGCIASVVSDSVQSQRRQPTRLLHPWDSPGKNPGVGCHFLLWDIYAAICKIDCYWKGAV